MGEIGEIGDQGSAGDSGPGVCALQVTETL